MKAKTDKRSRNQAALDTIAQTKQPTMRFQSGYLQNSNGTWSVIASLTVVNETQAKLTLDWLRLALDGASK